MLPAVVVVFSPSSAPPYLLPAHDGALGLVMQAESARTSPSGQPTSRGASGNLAEERHQPASSPSVTTTHCHNATPLVPHCYQSFLLPFLLARHHLPACPHIHSLPIALHRLGLTIATPTLGTIRFFVRLCSANHHLPLPSPLTSSHYRVRPPPEPGKASDIHACGPELTLLRLLTPLPIVFNGYSSLIPAVLTPIPSLVYHSLQNPSNFAVTI